MTFDEFVDYVMSLPPDQREMLQDEGLFLAVPPCDSGYDDTPPGYRMFARTGGNGVHFSMINGTESSKPVCMTTPACFDTKNLFLGESLHEFMCLGSAFGFFGLEQLVYSRDHTAAQIEQTRQGSTALKRLSLKFALKPWSNVSDRLSALNP